MADENTAPLADPSADAPAAAPAKPGLGRKFGTLAILMSAMIGEAAVFYFMGFGPGEGTPVAAEEKPDAAEAKKHGSDEDSQPVNDGLVEVTVDSFHSTNNLALADTIIHVTFNVVAIVPKKDQPAFEDAVNTANRARVQQAIQKVIRSSSLEDLNDPDLKTLRRLISEAINKVVHRNYVSEVVLTEFKTLEQ